MKPSKQDIYEQVTSEMVKAIDAGTMPWSPGWTGGAASLPLRGTGEAYQGINVIVLWCKAMSKGYSNPYWLTYKQAQAHGAQVRKGEKAATVVYSNRIIKPEQDASGNETERAIPYLKAYHVFNAEQIEGLPAKFAHTQTVPMAEVQRIAAAEAFALATGARIETGGAPLYRSGSDIIEMPAIERFATPEGYYSTLNHELAHWTGHPSRLDRQGTMKQRTRGNYAFEEMIAEISAAFTNARLGLASQMRHDHAPYIAGWLEVLKADKRAIFTAASAAARATDYLFSFQPPAETALAA